MAMSTGDGTGGAVATAADGTFSLDLDPGTYKIGFVDPTGTYPTGYYSTAGYTDSLFAATPVFIDASPVADVDVQLAAGRTVSGTLLSTTGTPVPGVAVLLESPAGELLTNAVTGGDGTWTAVVPPGSYVVEYLDPNGTWGSGYSGMTGTVPTLDAAKVITVDASDVSGVGLRATLVPPTASVDPLPTFLASSTIPVAWSATPGAAAVTSFDVRYRRAAWNGDLGGYLTSRVGTTSASATFTGLAGSTYCFSVRAHDALGSVSPWTTETCTAVPLDDRSLVRSGSWTKATGAASAYYKGTYLRSSSFGANLTRTTVHASSIALLVTTCKGCGSIKVYWGSTFLRTINLNSSKTVHLKLIIVKAFSAAKTGTLSIRVSSHGKKVIVDGVAIRRL